jgi:mono/diheme cytochrome c family protein
MENKVSDLSRELEVNLPLSSTFISLFVFALLSACETEKMPKVDDHAVQTQKNQSQTTQSQTNHALQRVGDPSRSHQKTQVINPAKTLFNKRCSRCHGERGDGRGVFANQLNPRPTDLTSNAWYQHTNEKRIKRVILGGGRSIGKSPMMPSHADLRNKRQLLNALVQYVINLAPRTPRTPQVPKTPKVK